MAEMIPEVPGDFSEVPYIERGERVRGKQGDDTGVSNRALIALTNRTAYLKAQFEQLVAKGLNVVGNLQDEADLEDLDPATLNPGDAYFIQGQLFAWNTVQWIGSGSLIGPRGITLQGTWPEGVPLPDRETAQVGDGYIWQNDLWILLPEPGTWESLNVKGPEGKDSYQIARDNGFQGTQQQWLTSLVGKSAYRSWLDLGNEGTEAQFIASLKSTEKGDKGDDGEKGDAATPFSVVDKILDVSGLPNPGVPEEAYYVGPNLFVWSIKTEEWINLGRIAGADAYDIAVADGFQGTRTEWLASLKSTEPGPASTVPGPQGPAAVPFKVISRLASEADLPIPGVQEEAYFVGVELFAWNDVGDLSEWINLGAFAGKDNYELAVLEGFDGTRAQWLETQKSTVEGPRGPRGYSITVIGRLPNNSQLPPINERDPGTGYIINDTGNLYVVNEAGTTWQNLGQFAALNNYQLWLGQGNEGTLSEYLESLKGQNGDSNYQLWLDAGNQGSLQDFFNTLKGTDGENGTNIVITGAVDTFAQLPANPEDQQVYAVREENRLYGRVGGNWLNLGTFKGADGENGIDGKSLDVIKVLTEDDNVPPPTAGNEGKAYVDLEGFIFFNINAVWVKGPRAGNQGDKGETGSGLRILGSVATVANLPNKATSREGDGWVARDTKLLYTLVDGEWNEGVDITGPASTVPGPRGEDGKSINILNAYETEGQLFDAHPTGELGQGYLVQDDLYIWSTANGGQWRNVGPVRGPEGKEGPAGPASIVPGPRGPRGASWITLPPGQEAPNAGFAGNVGDWAVSDTFKVFFKTADQGWVLWGQLVAGDVNSPAQSEGKVVRMGQEWVPVPVDEVESPLPGHAYVRILKEGSETETEWASLELPDFIVDVVDPEAGALYVRGANGWVKLPMAPTTAGKQYVQKGGEWASFDNYDLPIKPMNASGNIDPKTDQIIALDNSVATAKNLVLADGPKGTSARALTLVVTVTGAAGSVAFAATGATALGWNGGTPPSLTGSVTNVILYWTGTRWIGSLGAVVP